METTAFTFDASTPIGLIARNIPVTTRVFEKYHIDYCCGGKQSLLAACEHLSLNQAQLLTELEHARESTMAMQESFASFTIPQMVQTIVDTHHRFTKEELPLLVRLAEKVANAHGERDFRLKEVLLSTLRLATEMGEHMQKEESILFPMLMNLDMAPQYETISRPQIAQIIERMEFEHQQTGNELEFIRHTTENYKVPDWACTSYRALFYRLEQLEADVHEHIHKENNILFPAAIERERQPHR